MINELPPEIVLKLFGSSDSQKTEIETQESLSVTDEPQNKGRCANMARIEAGIRLNPPITQAVIARNMNEINNVTHFAEISAYYDDQFPRVTMVSARFYIGRPIYPPTWAVMFVRGII